MHASAVWLQSNMPGSGSLKQLRGKFLQLSTSSGTDSSMNCDGKGLSKHGTQRRAARGFPGSSMDVLEILKLVNGD
jgi:hypothetical protein